MADFHEQFSIGDEITELHPLPRDEGKNYTVIALNPPMIEATHPKGKKPYLFPHKQVFVVRRAGTPMLEEFEAISIGDEVAEYIPKAADRGKSYTITALGLNFVDAEWQGKKYVFHRLQIYVRRRANDPRPEPTGENPFKQSAEVLNHHPEVLNRQMGKTGVEFTITLRQLRKLLGVSAHVSESAILTLIEQDDNTRDRIRRFLGER